MIVAARPRRLGGRLTPVVLAVAIGGGALLYATPFLLPGSAQLGAAPALGIALGLAVFALVGVGLENSARQMGAASLALLATLVALDSALRMVLVTGIAGFSPIFFLLIVAGWALGPTFGFAMGALTIVISSALTGGLGPWVPYLAYAAALTGWLSGVAGLRFRSGTKVLPRLAELWAMALVAGVLGFLYGAITDLWFWPYLNAGVGGGPGLVQRFAAFYLASSAWWDAFRAVGNVVMVLLLGRPVVAALRRFRRRLLVTFA